MAAPSVSCARFDRVSSSPPSDSGTHCAEPTRTTPGASAPTSTRFSTTTRSPVAGRTPERGLVETSVAIALETLDPAQLPAEIAISALSLAELTAGPLAAGSASLRARRQDRLQRFEARLEALEFDSDCARAYGPVYAATLALGRKARGARAVDLMIAATARAHRLPLYTLDVTDFRGLDDLVEIVAVAQ